MEFDSPLVVGRKGEKRGRVEGFKTFTSDETGGATTAVKGS